MQWAQDRRVTRRRVHTRGAKQGIETGGDGPSHLAVEVEETDNVVLDGGWWLEGRRHGLQRPATSRKHECERLKVHR